MPQWPQGLRVPEGAAAASSGSDTSAPRHAGKGPLLADLMSGPNAPLTKAFLFCGWRCITIEWLLNPQRDLADEDFLAELHTMLLTVGCICAALDCSTKSRAHEIPRHFEDGRPAPQPLRSNQYPRRFTHSQGRDLHRVTRGNQACAFILCEIQDLAARGGPPLRSLHDWELPHEKAMMKSGHWSDTCYAATQHAASWEPDANNSA